ncbi:MAG TPA: zf-HC2 domain-containing protein [Bryobacteraceae bacterium]|nr:zf-HC2 domain-containing protein [Bryobacteraceae bacterium]
MWFRETHPTDQDLVLAADGELPARRVERLRKHLAGCWECRVRAQEFEGAIGEFVHHHRRQLDPLLPPAPGSRALLKARLDELASAHPSSWRQPLIGRLWIPVAVSAIVLVLANLTVSHRWTARQQPTLYARFVPISFPATELTPGVARAKTRDQVCRSNEGKNRDVPAALRRRVFELYGMPGADPMAYEVDYLISPALGGADDIGNLWPQSYAATIWNARVKDALEDRLHDLVCRGDVDLATAQREISTDWISAYKKYFHTDRPVD